MADVRHATMEELEAGLGEIRRSPGDAGVVELIVRRPGTDRREVLEEGALDPAEGLVGDAWRAGPGSGNPDVQLTLMNARAVALMAGTRDRWPLAGDQVYVDLDLSEANLPVGARLAVGTALVEITEAPHTGCAKFAARFGADALRFVNGPEGLRLRLRGVHARIVQAGTVRVGDRVRKIHPDRGPRR